TVRSEHQPERVPPTWKEFRGTREQLLDYRAVVEQAERALGSRAELLPYGGRLTRDIVPALFDRLGVEVRDVTPLPRRVNVSFDYLDCKVKRVLHDLRADPRTLRQFDGFVRAFPQRSGYGFFSASGRERLLARHAEG